MFAPYFYPNKEFALLLGDCSVLLPQFEHKFDMIFADPPYFLSNGGISISNGEIVCVDKGDWDKGGTPEYIQEFNKKWLTACKDKLKDNGTIWVSGTHHNIFSVADQLSELGFKILNVVTWAKTNPPDNLSHRMLTHSSEFIIWAKKTKQAYHKYNYELMKQLNDDKQMTDVWYMPAVAKWEKSCGKHPTQKPLPLLARIILASTNKNDWILDPFNGSGTTGIAAKLLERRFLGIDQDESFLELTKKRWNELEDEDVALSYRKKVLEVCHTAEAKANPNRVLVGRVGSIEQWNWMLSSQCYNLPISIILSTPKLLSAEYVLAFRGYDSRNARLYHVSKMKPQIKTKEQIRCMAKDQYSPSRDNSYWVIHMVDCDIEEIRGKHFEKDKLLGQQEQRGAYWIKNLEEVIASFEY